MRTIIITSIGVAVPCGRGNIPFGEIFDAELTNGISAESTGIMGPLPRGESSTVDHILEPLSDHELPKIVHPDKMWTLSESGGFES